MPSQSPSPGRRVSSTSRSTSPRPTPLTPGNKFDDDFDFPDPLSTVLDPGHLEFIVSDLSDELLDHVEPAEVNDQEDDGSSESTRSEPLPESPASHGKELNSVRSKEHHRSASVSSSPLKSALAPSPRPATKNEPHDHFSKRAHFDDDVVTSDVLVRRVMTEMPFQRRKSAPAKVPTSVRILGDRLSSSSSDDEDDEGAAAIGIFEEVIEELVQVAEEHEEAKAQLAAVAREVAEAILDSEVDYKGYDEDGTPNDSQDSEYDADDQDDPIVGAGHIRQSSADEDVDETFIEAEGIAVGDLSDKAIDKVSKIWSAEPHPQPEVLFLAETGLLKRLDLQSIKEDPTAESSNSSTETVIGPSTGKLGISLRRRVSDSHAHGKYAMKSEVVQRSASMTDFIKLQGKLSPLNVPSKASPAGCAVSVCSVRSAESPKLNTVYEHPEARSGQRNSEKAATKTVQTVRSDSGIFEVLWEEPPSTSSSCLTLFESSDVEAEPVTNGSCGTFGRANIQMDKVKTKLAAWSWAREHSLLDEHGNPKWIPLLSFEMRDSQRPSSSHTPRSEGPLCPPNTERPSGASSGKHSDVSSGKHSATRSPPGEHEIQAEDDDDDGDEPIELKIEATLSLPPKDKLQGIPSDYLDVPVSQSRSIPSSPGGYKHTKAISRQLSNLAAEDEHFKSHRDSLVLLRKREREEETMNQTLTNSQDSMILTRLKFETRYPNSGVPTRPGWRHIRELSPIPDASPPDSCRHSGGKMTVGDKSVRQGDTKPRESDIHPNEHINCPICEVERPRWFEANIKKGRSFL